MAFLEMKFHSDALGRGVSVNVILPEKAKSMIGMEGKLQTKYKTLYLLHGLSDDHSVWMRRTSIERYAAMRGIAVVMPAVERSWYTDTAYGANYFTFITKELPQVCRNYFQGMSHLQEDNFIAGLSMGGYGALKAALTYPENYAGCASLSGALDIVDFFDYLDIKEWRANFGFDLENASQVEGTKEDLFYLADNAAKFGRIYMCCGTEDGILSHSRKFHNKLQSLGVEHAYQESSGNHSWKYWDENIEQALDYILGE